MSDRDPRKVSITIPISNELAREGGMSSHWLEVAMGIRPDPRPPEQIAAAKAEYQRQAAERKASVEAEHAANLAAAPSDFHRAILDLHGPVLGLYGYAACGGCEFEGWEAEPVEWPCATYTLAMERRP